ncbi:MAG TPA: hypothetical protein VFE58_16110 [Tepidisphaeraceae bacterium]|jgi:hypothetical protein|nr:hypothetical protein [Tepidisphaeraceae bacterium]
MLRSLIASSVLLTAVAATFADTHTTGVPVLNSDPGAAYTIYLDFAGFNFTGTWAGGGAPGSTPAYDGAVGSFSTAEQANIDNIWARVAEKYAAFNINVTTVDPAVTAGQASTDAQRQAYYDNTAQMMHTVIGGTGSWVIGSPGTGISVIGVDKGSFYTNGSNNGAGSGYHTDWVFAGPYSSNTSLLGEVVSHENGHGLGLAHQSDFSGTTLVNEYSSNSNMIGYGSYAPVMGNSFSSQRGTWRIGYNKYHILQNDVQIIESNSGMGNFLDDGIAHSAASAAFLPLNGSAVSPGHAKGVIVPVSSTAPAAIGADNYTKDFFSFRTDGSLLSLTATDGGERLATGVADPGATLESTLTILDSSFDAVGTAIMNVNTLSETYTGILPAGRYYAVVASFGGYASITDTTASYYDIGSYFLTGSGFSAAKWTAGASSGDWSVAANWLGQVVPQATEDAVIGAGSIAAHSTGANTVQSLTNSGTLNITGGSIASTSYVQTSGAVTTISGGTLTAGAFQMTGGSLSIASSGTLNLTGTNTISGGTSDAIANAGTFNKSGVGITLVQVAMTNTGLISIHSGGGLSLSGGLAANAASTVASASAGSIAMDAGATLMADDLRQASLTSAGTVAIRPVASGGATSVLGSLTFTGSGSLDIADTRLIMTSGGADSVRQLILPAYDGGKWDGPGLTSSVAKAASSNEMAIGYATAGQLGITSWGGITGLDPSDIITRVTMMGDANLDGKINADDYALIDRGMQLHLGGWAFGDFDYSGSVDSMDYWLLDHAYLTQNGLQGDNSLLAGREAEFGAGYVTSLLASIPEPTMAGGLGLGVLLLRKRRR